MTACLSACVICGKSHGVLRYRLILVAFKFQLFIIGDRVVETVGLSSGDWKTVQAKAKMAEVFGLEGIGIKLYC